MRQKWSKEIICKKILDLHQKGEPIYLRYIQKKYSSLYSAAQRYFDSWRQAVEACDIEYKIVLVSQERWNKEIICQEISNLHQKGISIHVYYMQKNYENLLGASRYHFGSWRQAVEACGIDYEAIWKGSLKWTKEKIIAEIKERKNKEFSLTASCIQREDINLSKAAYYYFGKNGWAKAVKAAGFDYDKIRKCCPDGWWTKERIIVEIINISKDGPLPSPRDIAKLYPALENAARKHFCSWALALKAAGIPYQESYKNWSTKAWLETMSSGQHITIMESTQHYIEERRRS